MDTREHFSKRGGYHVQINPIKFRYEAPVDLRNGILQIALNASRLRETRLVSIIWKIIRKHQNIPTRFGPPPLYNVVLESYLHCEWFLIYDVVEAIYSDLLEDLSFGETKASIFSDEINDLFIEVGAGWQLIQGKIETRGDKAFEDRLVNAKALLSNAEMPRAENELQEAIMDLSRRPKPDLSGAVTHAMGALECVARTVANDDKRTLGEIIKKYPELFPKPLDVSLEKAWGYSSDVARHVKEGRNVSYEESQLIVGLSAVVSQYLIQKFILGENPGNKK
jgi:hypothetical protein